MRYHHVAVAAALLLTPVALRAQDPRVPADSVEQTFTLADGEFVRVTLREGIVYRATLEGGGLRLVLRRLGGEGLAPRIVPLLAGQGAANASVYRVHVLSSGDYEIRSAGGEPGKSVTLRLVRDPSPPKP